LASNSIAEVDLLDDFFVHYDVNNNPPDFKVRIQFAIKSNMINSIASSVIQKSVFCMSRQDEGEQFAADNALVTNLDDVLKGTVVCTSKHLTQFVVSFTPVRE
jgi:hypothetical protein